MIKIYTDGSCLGNPGKGGWAAIILNGGKKTELKGSKKDRLSGIIDFYFAANDYFMYEIAICVNALCFEKRASKFFLNKRKVKNLIKGYESVKKVSIKEKKSLNILCRGAAMRYFLTRLYDYSNTPKSALIKIKDPREYYQKLVIHNNLKTYKDYLK